MTRVFPKRFRTEERIRALTNSLTAGKLPSSFYDLLKRDGIDAEHCLLVELNEDQGSWFGGILLTHDRTVLEFEVEFQGPGTYGDYANWGSATVESWSRRNLDEVFEDPSERASRSANHPLRVAAELLVGEGSKK